MAWRIPLQGRTESNCDLRKSDLKISVILAALGIMARRRVPSLSLVPVIGGVVVVVVSISMIKGGGGQ